MMRTARFRILVAFSMFLFLGWMPALASDFPSAKPVTVICPYAAGGNIDIILRTLAETTRRHLGQQIIVENKPGGSATIGPATMAATAKPDGYTTSAILMGVYYLPYQMKTTWDPLKDFSYIIHVTGFVFGVVVKADSPWKTFQEFIAYAKANPGKISFGSPGKNATGGMVMDLIALKEGIKWNHIPLKGAAEDIPALLGGHVNAVSNTTSWAPQVDSGEFRLLVTWGEKRTKKWPNVPTLKEVGYGIVANSPWGIAGPKGMDPKIIKTLHDAFKKGMEDPLYLKTLDRFHMEPMYKSSEEYTKYARELNAEAKEFVEKLGLKQK